jgi:hypothetical protein
VKFVNLIGALVTRGFLLIAEPRVVRLLQFVVYTCMLGLGGYLLVDTPTAFEFVLGPLLVKIFGLFMTLGGIAGVVAVLPGIWWLERLAVISLWVGLGFYCIVSLTLGVSLAGTIIAFTLAVCLVQRWIGISKFQIAPRR